MYKVPRKLCAVSGNTAAFYRLFTGKTIYRWELVYLLAGCALRAGVVLVGSWFQSLMVLGKNEFPKASLLVLS
jgi:hypothetical protein